MKRTLLLMFAACIAAGACNTPKKTAAAPVAATDTGNADLTGAWELDFIANPSGTFEQLYTGKKPFISFNETENTFNGNSSCNSFRGKLEKDKNTISFKGDLMMTKMACMGDGEKIFLENLKRINHYSISKDGRQLSFMQGDMALMYFHRMAQ